MANYKLSKELDVVEPIESAVIVRVRSIADDGVVTAYSCKLRHPRFKNRFTVPHYYARFKCKGKVYLEDAPDPAALDEILVRDYLSGNVFTGDEKC
ncbi:hypothetical protein [Duganella vulcania]|uniref:Uncharacterized protein n=1 Tax=Duganella vulcania TaxID=2692166 RepID=A0A845GGD8_9BURK|nr:hypothetical protein [Duganella vulcania]MYM92472.1 hypothetical protein [Duganella vulcania]